MAHYAIVVDLDRCIGCHGCEIACKNENNIALGEYWNKVVERGPFGEYPDLEMYFLPTMCQQCQDAPCVNVCPTGASYRDADGMVLVDKEKCIGCKSCIMACPYGARYYRENEDGYFGSELNEYEAVMYTAMPQGRVDKCTFCVDRIDAGGNEPQACVAAYPAGARVFGDLETLKKQAESAAGFQLLPDEGANPSVWYLPNKVNA